MASIEEILATTQVVLTRYILPICFLSGIFGNICNIGIFMQRPLRLNSCSVYFTAAAFVNLLIISFGIIPTIFSSYVIEPALYLSWTCKLKLYGLHSLLMMSRTYMVLACVDQYAFSSPSVQLRQFSRRPVALKLLPVVLIVWLLVPIHMLIFVDIQILYVRCGTSGTYSLIYSIYSFIFTLLPLILMIIFSLLAFYNLRHVNRRVLPVVNNQVNHGNLRRRKYDDQVMMMLICQVIIYLISTILHPTNTLYMTLTTVPSGGPRKSPLRLAIEGFITYLVWGFLIYINSCSTFYVNFCVSKVFRKRFYNLLNFILNWCRCVGGGRQQRRVGNTNLSTTAGSVRR